MIVARTLLTLTAMMLAGSALAQGHTITGDIAYRERMALPETAIATIALVDVSLADAPATTIVEQVIDPAGQIPIGFVLNVDEAQIEDGQSYALAARIEVEGELWFINDTRISIDPLTQVDPVAVELVSARTDAAPEDVEPDAEASSERTMPQELAGTSWMLATLAGSPAAEDADSTLVFNADEDSVGGNGGCNSYGGTIAFDEDRSFAITEIISTMMACDEPDMGQERALFEALGQATTYTVETDTLVLSDADGEPLATFTATPPSE